MGTYLLGFVPCCCLSCLIHSIFTVSMKNNFERRLLSLLWALHISLSLCYWPEEKNMALNAQLLMTLCIEHLRHSQLWYHNKPLTVSLGGFLSFSISWNHYHAVWKETAEIPWKKYLKCIVQLLFAEKACLTALQECSQLQDNGDRGHRGISISSGRTWCPEALHG